MDLLISYSWGHLAAARREALHLLKKLGDPDASIDRTEVWGIAIAHSSLDSREVIRRIKALYRAGERIVEAIKWVPADYWCATDLDAMKAVIENHIVDRIAPSETWRMVVKKRLWQRYPTIDIVTYLAEAVDRKVDLSDPDWILRVDVVGNTTAISLLAPDEFSSFGLRA